MFSALVNPEIQQLIKSRNFKLLRDVLEELYPVEIATIIDDLPAQDDIIVFRLLPRDLAVRTFEQLEPEKQHELVDRLAKDPFSLSTLLNDLSPDDRTSLFEELPGHITQRLMRLLSPEQRRIALTLLGYPPESVGRLMTPDYISVSSSWTVGQVLEHIRKTGSDSETLNVLYVVDDDMKLVGDIRIRRILLAEPDELVEKLTDGRLLTLKATQDQESVIEIFQDYDRTALPVTDTDGVLIGIVTIDDVIDVMEEEVTEDIQKVGGTEALDGPYIETPLFSLVRKRASWLIVLFIGELLTTYAMGHFEEEIAKAVVLALFVPLIISSGGNSGSQAATLVIRAMALGEIQIRDWWTVMKREVFSGISLGGILGLMGFLRVAIGEAIFGSYGAQWPFVAMAVGSSLVFVVLWGTLTGSMLPFILKKIGADPATSSAPFVATIVDVTGLLIYFSIAMALMKDSLA